MKNILQKLILDEHLSENEASEAIHFLLDDAANEIQKAALLVLLRSKGETVTELSAGLSFLRSSMKKLDLSYPVVDFVGTGGDQLNTVNISTASALLAAACGVKILKHGNRAVSSLAGSADVLSALNISINLTPEQTIQSLDNHHFGFCYAPNYHPALKKLAPLRQKLKVPTLFNLLAPLLNPAPHVHFVLGIADKQLLDTYATLLMQHQTLRSVIVHQQGLDELCCLGPIALIEINKTKCKKYTINPEHFGLKRCSKEDLAGKDADYNAAYIKHTLSGEKTGLSDTLILNAGMGLYLSNTALPLIDAIEKARSVLHSGKANQLLHYLSIIR